MSATPNLQLTFEPLSDVGMERSENQDAFGFKLLDEYHFYFVCDGMGGHAGGSVASRLAVDVIEQSLEASELPIVERIVHAIQTGNAEIHGKASRHRELRGMGTTVVFLGIDRSVSKAWVAHVGDSRLYLLRGDTLKRVTKDHTMVQRLVDDGILTPEQAENHPNSNVISRSLGGRPDVDVEITPEPIELQTGDIFVLCSDGLHGLVTEAEIAETVSRLPPAEAARKLVDRANEEGGHDNITVEVILVGELPEPRDAYRIEHPPSGPGAGASRHAPSTTPMGAQKTSRTIQIDASFITGASPAPPVQAPPVESGPPMTDIDREQAKIASDYVPQEVEEDLVTDNPRQATIWAVTAVGAVLIAAVLVLFWLFRNRVGA